MPTPSLPEKPRDKVIRVPTGARRTDGYDSPLKEAQFAFFRRFLEFYFRYAHDDIDWSKGFESLETELRQIAGRRRAAALRVDSLFRVTRKSGEGQLVLIHSEFQISRDPMLAERIFRYNYRAFDAQNHEVVSFVILGDPSPSWRPDSHGWKLWGCEMGIRFPVVKLIDYVGREEELKASDNPFGIMTFAFLKTRETQDDMEKRRHFKMQATRALYEKNYTAEEVRLLFRTIDWMMALDEEQEIIYLDELNQLEAEKAMAYVTSVERISMKRGLEQGRLEGLQEGRQVGLQEGRQVGLQEGRQVGLQEGRQVGLQEGRQVGLQEGLRLGLASLLLAQLSQRFGEVPAWVSEKLGAASTEKLEVWGRRVLEASSVDEVFV